MKIKSTLVSVVVFFVTLAVGLVFVEFALRVKNSSMQNYNIEMWRYAKFLKKVSKDPFLGHEHVASSKAVLQSVEIRTNSLGLRGPEVKSLSPARRILFLGSSITLGWGIDEKDTMTALLQERFTAKGEDVEVLNAGIGNYNATRYIRRFFTRFESLQPTDIVVNYFVNDAEVLKAGGGNVLLRNSQLAVTVWNIVQVRMNSGANSLVDHYKAVYAEGAPGYKAMVDSMKQLAAYAQKNNVRLYLLMTPDIHQLQDYPFHFIHDKIASLGRDLGFTVCDSYDALKIYPAEKLWTMPGDPHPNELGNKVMADVMEPVLRLQD
jgi:lysophospholipase L1-like esterase